MEPLDATLGDMRAPALHGAPGKPAPLSSAPVLSFEGVVKRWGRDSPPVLDGVDLELAPGSTVAVTGRNGAGKTTLLRIVAGLVRADRGEVRLCGLDPEADRTEYHRRLGFAGAGNTGLYARLNVEHHLDFWARLALIPREGRSPAIERTSRAFALDPLMGLRVDRLSMGQRQRLRLALAFLHDPTVVALDEPLTSLDTEGASLLAGALADLELRGGAALVCAPTPLAGLGVDVQYAIREGQLEPA